MSRHCLCKRLERLRPWAGLTSVSLSGTVWPTARLMVRRLPVCLQIVKDLRQSASALTSLQATPCNQCQNTFAAVRCQFSASASYVVAQQLQKWLQQPCNGDMDTGHWLASTSTRANDSLAHALMSGRDGCSRVLHHCRGGLGGSLQACASTLPAG